MSSVHLTCAALVHVWESCYAPKLKVRQHHRRLAQEYLDKQVKALTEAGLKDVRGILRRGDIDHEINDYAQLAQADLIIVSTRGLSTGGLGDLASRTLGNIALKILMTAPCPVLLLRAVT